ncbi:MAG: PTPA-CTERM sorting domain-containing protein [Leptolyngbya sp. SIO3F4]|nr:PTPA-CTERM sorting domain-containing protein [Leptolyngbya sp. SIO3F4]
MNFKTSMLKTVTAATVCIAGAAVSADAAHAALLSGSVELTTSGNFNLTPNLIDFDGAFINSATGSFSPLLGGGATIQDINLTPPTTVLSSITPFIDFGSVILEGETGQLVFNLTSAAINTAVNEPSIAILISQNLQGTFQFGNTTVANGLLVATSFVDTDGFSFNLTTEAVPTPALLPGLIGLGLSIVRKRKQQEDLTE